MMELWTSPTPNGWKVSIMLEELIEAGVDVGDVQVRMINLLKGDQFKDDFVERNLNSKIPTLRDDGRDIIESCAILEYLGEKFPTSLLPLDTRKWDVLPWVYWQAANVGPIFGNKLSYTRYMDDVADELKQHPLERFNNEALRLVSVLDKKLGDNPWVCGMNLLLPISHFTLGYEVGSGARSTSPLNLVLWNGSTEFEHDPAWSAAWATVYRKAKSISGAKNAKPVLRKVAHPSPATPTLEIPSNRQ